MKTALENFARGEFLIVVDDESRENEGDLIILAEKATPEKVAFMVRHTTGILCVAITENRARALELPLMVDRNQDKKKTAFTISVDAKDGLTTGVSALERSNTVRALASQSAHPTDFVRPGHIFPLIADRNGLANRRGHTEAGVALAQLVGATPAALLSEIINDDGTMTRGKELADFAKLNQIQIISIADLQSYFAQNKVISQSEFKSPALQWAQLPTQYGMWEISSFSGISQREQAVLRYGNSQDQPLVRIHSECLTGDIFGSKRCDCGQQLDQSMSEIQEHGNGYVIYLRNHEGRGIGLAEKIKAYQLQDQGLDTVDANISLGHPVDARDWNDAIEIIRTLGIKSLTLLTNNPEKVAAVRALGISCTQRSIKIEQNRFNEKYLSTKAERLGHRIVAELARKQGDQ